MERHSTLASVHFVPIPAGTFTMGREDGAPSEGRSGALEGMSAGRSAAVSCACHWAVNMSVGGSHGRMWAHAYSWTVSGIYVAPDSPIDRPEDLAGVHDRAFLDGKGDESAADEGPGIHRMRLDRA